MIMNFICVALGGGLGALLRYGISLLPWKGGFPVLTLITNLLGALLIGVISGLAESRRNLGPGALLFWKTGVCGGFTTFSTFSLEAVQLLEKGEKWYAAAYVLLSVCGCMAGVCLGRRIAARGL